MGRVNASRGFDLPEVRGSAEKLADSKAIPGVGLCLPGAFKFVELFSEVGLSKKFASCQNGPLTQRTIRP
jgi:hypothetical protein